MEDNKTYLNTPWLRDIGLNPNKPEYQAAEILFKRIEIYGVTSH